jgi:iron complex outermembrane receptor protein
MRVNRALKVAVAYALAAASSMAVAQTPPPASTAAPEMDTVIVTGSYIRGSAEDAALPVDVITSEDLLKQGSPSTLDILKTMPVSNGVLGDSNQFDSRSQGSEGSGSVNLRGLGPTRTLVLMNGRRMVNSPFTGAPDTNLLPMSAVGRLEVLKDGAAATYGSDAIAGVVNFITKTGRTAQGFEASADYKYIADSDGDYTVGLSYGWAGDSIDFLVSGGYQHRSELMARDRDWAVRPYFENPQGGWSAAGNPATFLPAVNSTFLGTFFRDPQCQPLGGVNGFTLSATGSTVPVCYWQYTQFDALTEKEDRYQLYAEMNADLFDSVKLHVEGMYSHTETPIYRTSPSYAALQTPSDIASGGTSQVNGQYYVPATNPGFIQFNAANPGVVPANVFTIPGAGAWVVAYRPFAIGGNPLFGYDSSEGPREYDAFRLSTSLKGSVGSLFDWDVGVTYMEQINKRQGRDSVVNRVQLGFRGLGGPNCDVASAVANNTPGQNGCLWLNPFSTAIPRNAITGVVNSQFATNGVPNDNPELLNWVFPKVSTEQTADIIVLDAVANGELPLSLPGGEIGWAFGGQYRDSGFKTEYSDLNNFAVTPCVNSVATGIVGPDACTPEQLAAPAGALLFLGGSNNVDFSQDVFGVFGELSLPILENLQAQVAVRYEDYGGDVGDTIDPKLGVKWTITDSFALRGSVGTTFRGPTAANVSPGTVTNLQSIQGTFRAVRTAGNPELESESALTMNFGAIIKAGGLTATVDYWSFDMEDQIVAEPVGGISTEMFKSPLNCTSDEYAALRARFSFGVGGCAPGNIQRLDVSLINGPDLKTSGIDLGLQYLVDDADLEFGANFTYVLEYKTGDVYVEGILVQPAFDAAGKLNYQTTAYPIPELKGNLYVQYAFLDNHNLRWQANYVGGYEDQRTDIYLPYHATNNGATGNTNGTYNAANNLVITGGKVVKATTLHSLYYNVQLPANLSLSLAVENVFDKDPSFARLDYSYDPFTGSAFGRTVKAGLRAKF